MCNVPGKVMFPNVETMFRSDIKTMKDFCALAQPEHLVLLSEVEKQFLTEFDFREEAKNLNLIRENMRNAWRKKVGCSRPGVHLQFSWHLWGDCRGIFGRKPRLFTSS